MDVHARLVAVVAEATSPAEALNAATRVVAEALGADACAIFVRRTKNGLELRAQYGPTSDPVATDAGRTLAEGALDGVLPRRGDGDAAGIAAVPVAAINHGIGAIVVRRAETPFTAEEIMRLSGVASQIVELIENERLIETIERSGTGRELTDEGSGPPPSTGERILRGVGASPGIAIGFVTFRNAFPRALVYREAPPRGAAAESLRVRDALQKAQNDLLRLQSAAAAEIGEEQALVFGAHLLLLKDPSLIELVQQRIAAGRTAPAAIDAALDEIAGRLRRARDPYLQERVEDIEDLRSRILGHLLGVERQGAVDARVVVSDRTTPSLVVELKARGARGIASAVGGPTSHGALLARALGIPAVCGIIGLMDQVSPGDTIIVDGYEGQVVVRPAAKTKDEYEHRRQKAEQQRTEFFRYRDVPAMTADGVRFELQANVGLGADIEAAVENHADGIGLYRTEFPFIVRDALPSVEEQVKIYERAFRAFPTAPVTFRLLDLAGDKFLPSGELGVARDAFHGYRSIRVLFDYPHVLRDQVQAFAIAAGGRELRVLIPMVTSVEDVVRIKQLAAEARAQSEGASVGGPIVYGAMVETPAAVELIDELAKEVDFFSIGTNDLVQYTLVVDREDPRMASERHAYHPAVLRMVHRVATRARANGKRVAVCGEMAARPELAIALLAFGIDSLSVTPRFIPYLKQALAQVPVEPLRANLDALLRAATADEVEALLRRYARSGDGVTSPGTPG